MVEHHHPWPNSANLTRQIKENTRFLEWQQICIELSLMKLTNYPKDNL